MINWFKISLLFVDKDFFNINFFLYQYSLNQVNYKRNSREKPESK